MNVKIATEGVFDGKRVGKDSVVEVSAETFEKNQSWMKATDEPVDHKAPAKEKKPSVPPVVAGGDSSRDGDKS